VNHLLCKRLKSLRTHQQVQNVYLYRHGCLIQRVTNKADNINDPRPMMIWLYQMLLSIRNPVPVSALHRHYYSKEFECDSKHAQQAIVVVHEGDRCNGMGQGQQLRPVVRGWIGLDKCCSWDANFDHPWKDAEVVDSVCLFVDICHLLIHPPPSINRLPSRRHRQKTS